MSDSAPDLAPRPAASDLSERLAALERRVASLEAVESIRHTLSDYARALDERRRDLLARVFTDDCHVATTPWGGDTRGNERMLRMFDRYWQRFANPRRYYANEAITVDGDTATAFTYWFVTQDDGDRSVIGWGTYDWAFRREADYWRASELLIHVLTMTTLDRGWAIPDRIMQAFLPRSAK